ncbi:LacI family DNA-binding transcriptional regulator [Kiritimatiellaeota bacterium B1221]|nr:LacI family DNA-binding transcriptional regulator [Kiritimatiellaeota bacterium B1221]
MTLKQLAAELGLSVQAVSLAIRGQRGVSDATRERVRKHAESRGYQPDAGLRALADYRTKGMKAATRWNQVALLHNWYKEGAFLEDHFYTSWFKHLSEVAAERGIQIEQHWLGADGERMHTVLRLLQNRGITGVFLAPPALTPNPPAIQIPHKNFQVVTFGPEHLYPDFHTVQFDFYENLRLAWRVLTERGFKRIGLVYAKHQGWRTGDAWRAAFHVEKLRSGCTPGQRMPLEIDIAKGQDTVNLYRNWFREGKYDAVISSIRYITDWHDPREPLPEIAQFDVRAPEEQGIDLNLPQMAKTAMELLYMEMQRSLITEQALPFRVHIPGNWVNANRT